MPSLGGIVACSLAEATQTLELSKGQIPFQSGKPKEVLLGGAHAACFSETSSCLTCENEAEACEQNLLEILLMWSE